MSKAWIQTNKRRCFVRSGSGLWIAESTPPSTPNTVGGRTNEAILVRSHFDRTDKCRRFHPDERFPSPVEHEPNSLLSHAQVPVQLHAGHALAVRDFRVCSELVTSYPQERKP